MLYFFAFNTLVFGVSCTFFPLILCGVIFLTYFTADVLITLLFVFHGVFVFRLNTISGSNQIP